MKKADGHTPVVALLLRRHPPRVFMKVLFSTGAISRSLNDFLESTWEAGEEGVLLDGEKSWDARQIDRTDQTYVVRSGYGQLCTIYCTRACGYVGPQHIPSPRRIPSVFDNFILFPFCLPFPHVDSDHNKTKQTARSCDLWRKPPISPVSDPRARGA
jgi:hypothetical protein